MEVGKQETITVSVNPENSMLDENKDVIFENPSSQIQIDAQNKNTVTVIAKAFEENQSITINYDSKTYKKELVIKNPSITTFEIATKGEVDISNERSKTLYTVFRPYDFNTSKVEWVVEGDTNCINFVDNNDGSCKVDVKEAGGQVRIKAKSQGHTSNEVVLNTKGVVVTKMSDGRKGHQLFPDQTIKLEFPDPTAQIEYEIYDSEDDADKEIDSKKNSKPLKVYNGEAISIEEPNFAKDGTVHYGSYKYESGNKYKVLKYKATYNGETFGPVTKSVYKIRQDNVCSTLDGLKAKLGDSNTYTSGEFDLNDLGIDCDNLNELFSKKDNFNGNISYWDVSKIKTMIETFYSAKSFDQPLSNWDTSNVTSLYCLFWESNSFNQSINNWDVSNVVDMTGIFNVTGKFNQPLDKWGDQLSNVTQIAYLFYYASVFDQNISNWQFRNKMKKEFNNPLRGNHFNFSDGLPFGDCPIRSEYKFKYEVEN